MFAALASARKRGGTTKHARNDALLAQFAALREAQPQLKPDEICHLIERKLRKKRQRSERLSFSTVKRAILEAKNRT